MKKTFPALALAVGLFSGCSALHGGAARPPIQALTAPAAYPQTNLVQASEQIKRILTDTGLPQNYFALTFVSIPDGKPLLSLNEAQPMIPASNAKLATTAAALFLLGPDYRFHTDAGLHEGTLYIKGSGDPTLEIAHLKDMARAFRAHSSAAAFNGTVVLDAGLFDEYEQINPDFNAANPSNTGLGALSVDRNSVVVHLTADKINGSGIQNFQAHAAPDPEGFSVVQSSKPVNFDTHHKPQFEVSWNQAKSVHEISLLGPLQAGRFPLALRRPTQNFGRVFAKILKNERFQVKRMLLGRAPPQAQLIYSQQSPPLSEILRRMNLESDSFIAEQTLLALGASQGGRTLGDGVKAAAFFLTGKAGLAKDSFKLENGSGLSREARFSPVQLAQLLAYMSRQKALAGAFEGSLPIAGWSGTMRHRLLDPPGLLSVSAKTGMIDYVHCVAGYGVNASGKKFAFSLMFNDMEGLRLARYMDVLGRESEPEWQKTTAVNERFKALQDRILETFSATKF